MNTAYYYGQPDFIDWAFYAMGFLAFAARIAAWGKQRLDKAAKRAPGSSAPLGFRLLGGALIGLGLLAAVSGAQWQKAMSGILTGPDWSARLELWFPFWPFEPFLPLLVIGTGTMLATAITTQRERVASAA